MKDLQSYLAGFYREEEYPALRSQIETWSAARPLAGLRVLDGTPVFRNTMTKYLALLAGGAELAAVVGDGIPHDPEIARLLPEFGIPVLAGEEARRREFDVVLDCAGVNTGVKSKFGYVELTRSGMYHYRECRQPVFLADDGRIKVIETGLGTGDGFRRGMSHVGHGDFRGRRIVLFGCGKVGRGIAMYALLEGALLTVVDDASRVKPPAGASLVDFRDRMAVEAALEEAWCVVSATGRAGALTGCFDMAKLAAGKALIANMGVEDEFGPELPAERVLNGKAPLNFVLEEPTQLKYIDPTMALDNAGIPVLLAGGLPAGLARPAPELEEEILDVVRKRGEVAAELSLMEEFL